MIESVLEGMIAYQRAGLLAPIDDLFDKWQDKDQFIPSTIKALTLNGKLYGVPYNTNVRVLLYRKDLFEKYGLTPPKTWGDFLQDAATISSKESGIAGIGLTTKDGSVRTFQEFISFFFEANNGENPYKYDEAGKSAMVPMGPWIYQYRSDSAVAKKIFSKKKRAWPRCHCRREASRRLIWR